MKLFIDEDSDTRLARRLRRDIAERGRDVDGILTQYTRFVKPAFDDFILPTKAFADLVVPHGASNTVAITLVAQHLRAQIRERNLRAPSVVVRTPPASLAERAPSALANVHVLPLTNEIHAIHTLIRDHRCARSDFVFHSSRLSRLLLEYSLEFMPWRERVVTTPTDAPYHGVELASPICGVSVIRGGECMQDSLRVVIKGCEVGIVSASCVFFFPCFDTC